MRHNGRQDDYDDLGPDTQIDVTATKPVEFAADFHVALTIPFRGSSLTELEDMAHELGITPIDAAEQLIKQGLAARSASRRG